MTAVLYGFALSPYVLIARAGLEELGVDYKLVAAVPHSDDPGFVKASPLGKIPAATDGEFSIDDSTAIVAYFDYKVHGDDKKSIFGNDAQSRARIVKLEKYLQIDGFDISNRFFRHFRSGGSDEQLKEIQQDAAKVLDYLESELQDDAYFIGKSHTAADTTLIGRLIAYHLAQQKLDKKRYPKLSQAYERAANDPKFARIIADAEVEVRKLAGK